MKIGLTALAVFIAASVPAHAANKTAENWVGTWASAPAACPVRSGEPSAGDSTYRNVMRISIGGKSLRVQLTNEFGNSDLLVGAARIAVDAGHGTTKPGTDHALTFNGRSSVTIPANGLMLSDEVPMEVAPLSTLAVSVYVQDQEIAAITCHELGMSANYITKGDATAAAALKTSHTSTSWNFVKAIDVVAGEKAFAVVTFGDSITDGYCSTPDANRRWPDYFAARLQKEKGAGQIGVLNEGISGNRILRNVRGPSAIARFDRDVLASSGAKYLVILEGINDLDWDDPAENASAEELIGGLTQLIARAHSHGLIVYLATLTPYLGRDTYTEKGDAVRIALNNWIRNSGAADGVIDFDRITGDPAKPLAFDPRYDCGDHVHPSDAGYAAMANGVDLKLFP
ncbi:MAG TPA: SGNH/GDSL hydrolase family protein [Candidatus Acidoferrales bacterium]